MFDEIFEGFDSLGSKVLFETPTVGFTLSAGLSPNEISEALGRHRAGDWGECTDGETEANNYSLQHGGCVLSIFRNEDGDKFCVLTEDVGTEWSFTSLRSFDDYIKIAD